MNRTWMGPLLERKSRWPINTRRCSLSLLRGKYRLKHSKILLYTNCVHKNLEVRYYHMLVKTPSNGRSPRLVGCKLWDLLWETICPLSDRVEDTYILWQVILLLDLYLEEAQAHGDQKKCTRYLKPHNSQKLEINQKFITRYIACCKFM